MKYLGIFVAIVVLGGAGLAMFKPPAGMTFGSAFSGGANTGSAGSGEYISHGDYVSFAAHLPEEDGMYVLFQFTADWCPGCIAIEPHVADLVAEYDNITRKKVDIVSWDSNASQQMNEFFDAGYIPFFAMYDAEGEPVAVGDFDEIVRAVKR